MKDIELARDLFETTSKPCSLGDCFECRYFNKDNICIELKQAESLVARGYQKVKWHKVSEGDFPHTGTRVLGYYVKDGHGLYDFCYYGFPTKSKFSRITVWGDSQLIDVIAWMEIPEYSEKKSNNNYD